MGPDSAGPLLEGTEQTQQKGTIFNVRNQLVLKARTERISNNIRVLVLLCRTVQQCHCTRNVKWNGSAALLFPQNYQVMPDNFCLCYLIFHQEVTVLVS